MFAQDKVRFVKIQITIECHIPCQHLDFQQPNTKARCPGVMLSMSATRLSLMVVVIAETYIQPYNIAGMFNTELTVNISFKSEKTHGMKPLWDCGRV
jgi:hypothetical protein